MPNQRDPETASEETTRRSFLKQGAKGALLLPYVAPAIETILLSDAHAQRDDDDDDGYGSSKSGSSNSGSPSVIGNAVPPPPGSNANNDNASSNSAGDEGRKFGEPKERNTSDNSDK